MIIIIKILEIKEKEKSIIEKELETWALSTIDLKTGYFYAVNKKNNLQSNQKRLQKTIIKTL